ncbi:ABC transporter ATP-binding protein [Pseudogulbenkiania subflava]|uniref:Lipoprotein-releasing system ATP-binding protein n=1 Tax=Pseudogulbenkiania subflava DSM 22618 TaxID=1123014 RepID=A0A1Y6C8Q5_9NEIS|nr:ABC transporter ATP-binding protein [Pseudogulbenkiania subflava]SMF48562.1 lipoprotein-releasing system ATP-binding protein [Pseudogulbenkiania subflava DSM 22618]
MSTVLRTESLTRVLPGDVPTTLVENIDLEIARGEFVAIMGPSGSGKSSLLYLLGLLDMPTAGQVWLDDTLTTGLSEDHLAHIRLERIGFVFQFHFLLEEFSALDNVMLPMRKLARLTEEEAHDKASELLHTFGLAEQMHKRPSQMSGGQRQRVAVARALANDPQLILADEPSGSLDTHASANVRDILHDLARNQNRAVVAVTHDPTFAQAADRRIFLVDGQLQPPERAAALFEVSVRH